MRRNPDVVARAKKLRRSMSKPERLLWKRLNRAACPDPIFRCQHMLLDWYVADSACLKARLVIEIDGFWSHWEKGDYDRERQQKIEELGFEIVRIAASRVLADPDEVASNMIELARSKIQGCE